MKTAKLGCIELMFHVMLKLQIQQDKQIRRLNQIKREITYEGKKDNQMISESVLLNNQMKKRQMIDKEELEKYKIYYQPTNAQ